VYVVCNHGAEGVSLKSCEALRLPTRGRNASFQGTPIRGERFSLIIFHFARHTHMGTWEGQAIGTFRDKKKQRNSPHVV